MSLLPPEANPAAGPASACGAARDDDGTQCLSREARVVAVEGNRIHFELLALPGCSGCPGGLFCPSSKLRAAQTLVLPGADRTSWTVGDLARLQIRAQSVSPVAWKLFGWPLLSVLVTAALISQIVSGPHQDLAIVAATSVAATLALWIVRSRLSLHRLVVSAVAVDDTAGSSLRT